VGGWYVWVGLCWMMNWVRGSEVELVFSCLVITPGIKPLVVIIFYSYQFTKGSW
jgi:hypothetical protein